jgi:hypothetical protein
MGADTFFTKETGTSAQDAFRNAVEQACYDHGHSGYTGTIAEKHEFVVIPLPSGEAPYPYAEKLIADRDPRIDDKWGPAGCFDLGENQYFFFGWASS